MENNIEKKYWGKKFHGSRMKTVLSLLLIVLVFVAIKIMLQNKKSPFGISDSESNQEAVLNKKVFSITTEEASKNRNTAMFIPGFYLLYDSDFTATPSILGSSNSDDLEERKKEVQDNGVFTGVEFRSEKGTYGMYDYQDSVSINFISSYGEWNNPEYEYLGEEVHGENIYKKYKNHKKTEQNPVISTIYIIEPTKNIQFMVWHDDTTGIPLSIDLASLKFED